MINLWRHAIGAAAGRDRFIVSAVADESRPMEPGCPSPNGHDKSVPTEPDYHRATYPNIVEGERLLSLMRAYRHTGDEALLAVAQRSIALFERDILDGGLCAPVGEDGIFFEEIAAYPATHALAGHCSALLGLCEYATLTDDPAIGHLIQQGVAALHRLLDEYDSGFWVRLDLQQRRLATPRQLARLALLLEALAAATDCAHCDRVAQRWRGYLRRPGTRLCYLLSKHTTSLRAHLLQRVHTLLFPPTRPSQPVQVCVPITGFPVTGGTRAVLTGIAQVMDDAWQLQYVTQHEGPHSGEYIIHRFGNAKTHPWQFPAVWFYLLAGCCKLLALLRGGAGYRLLLPQDGVFTAAYTALAGKLAGVRVVCIDHGNLTLLKSTSYRAERRKALEVKNWSKLRLLLGRLQYLGYWPTLRLLAHISARLVDHFFIPGVAGDGVEEACAAIGIPSSRLTRFASTIDVERYPLLNEAARARMRQERGLPCNAVVIAMVCRLTPEKGIDIALAALSQALAQLPAQDRERVRVIVAGEGPLRPQIEADLRRLALDRTVTLWGEKPASEVATLLSLSDIFLYTSVRGACLSMAILEAMASGCAVIASTLPLANVQMLDDGRGISVPPGDACQTGEALARLLREPELCRSMGRMARAYVAEQHNATRFRRALLRVTGWNEDNKGALL